MMSRSFYWDRWWGDRNHDCQPGYGPHEYLDDSKMCVCVDWGQWCLLPVSMIQSVLAVYNSGLHLVETSAGRYFDGI